jgi:hypothetical protein
MNHSYHHVFFVFILIYYIFTTTGLNSLDMVKKNLKVIKAKEAALKAIAAVKNAASGSEWNFAGKLQLMEAEHRSVLHRGFSFDQILACYDSAIAHAKQSRFIHEEGLACEKAGLFCKKVQDYGRAQSYFNQARACYSEWGSSVKVAFIQNELNNLYL